MAMQEVRSFGEICFQFTLYAYSVTSMTSRIKLCWKSLIYENEKTYAAVLFDS